MSIKSRERSRECSFEAEPPQVLYRERHCLVAFKPARMPTAGDDSGDLHLLDWVKKNQSSYLTDLRSAVTPVKPFVVPVHFLDRPVSGAVLFALSTKGASRLCEQFRERTVDKTYLALVEVKDHWREDCLDPSTPQVQPSKSDFLSSKIVEDLDSESSWSLWVDYLAKDHEHNKVYAAHKGHQHTAKFRENQKLQRCALYVRPLATGFRKKDASLKNLGSEAVGRVCYKLLEIKLGTGRSHQIRVQCAARGLPIVGDVKYGARPVLASENRHSMIALHALSLCFESPVGGEKIRVMAPLPRYWDHFVQWQDASLISKMFEKGFITIDSSGV